MKLPHVRPGFLLGLAFIFGCVAANRLEFPAPTTPILNNVPLARQSTAYSCGAAALQSVLDYYGNEYTETEVMKAAQTTEDGTEIENMVEAAKKNNLKAESRVNTTLDELAESIQKNNPVIVEIKHGLTPMTENQASRTRKHGLTVTMSSSSDWTRRMSTSWILRFLEEEALFPSRNFSTAGMKSARRKSISSTQLSFSTELPIRPRPGRQFPSPRLRTSLKKSYAQKPGWKVIVFHQQIYYRRLNTPVQLANCFAFATSVEFYSIPFAQSWC